MRSILRRFAAYDATPDALLRPHEREEASRRQENDDAPAEDLLEYLDLRQCFDLLSRYSETLPAGLAAEVKTQIGAVDIVNVIRRRLAHSRPLQPDDPERLNSALEGFQNAVWRELRAARSAINDTPAWAPPLEQRLHDEDRILNNVPLPDYDETTLVGRDEIVDRVVKLLLAGSAPVLTLTGEGGIGKTAVAYAVAHRILDSESVSFDAVLWVSLKRERLTADGVQEIRNALSDVQTASMHLGRQLDGSFAGGVRELGEALKGLRVLICFDNLETISGDEFIELYDALPAETRYLVTSRNGLGQLERRIPIPALGENDAMILLGRLIGAYQPRELSRLTKAEKRSLCADLRYSPLAMKWLVLASAAGRPAANLLSNQEELLEFCVTSVYERLSPSAKIVLLALYATGKEAALSEVAVLVEEPLESLTTGMQELVQGSLVLTRMATDPELETFLSLTDTARAYLVRIVRPNDHELLEIRQRMDSFRRSQEVRQVVASTRTLAPWVVHCRSELDNPAAHLLHQALVLSQHQQYDNAMEQVARAKSIAPHYFEVFRVEAFIAAASGVYPEGAVTETYLRALDLAETDFHRGVVSHFLSGYLSRTVKDLSAAIKYAKLAHQGVGSAETEMALGRVQCWAGEYGTGIQHLENAAEGLEGKSLLVCRTALMDAWLRYTRRALSEEASLVEACARCVRGLAVGLALAEGGTVDDRYRETFCDLQIQLVQILATAARRGISLVAAPPDFGRLALIVPSLTESHRYGALVGVAEQTRELLAIYPGGGDYSDALADETMREPEINETNEGGELGVVVTLQSGKGYGFIQAPHRDANVFFHASALNSPGGFALLSIGDSVRFAASADDDGRLRATWVGRV